MPFSTGFPYRGKYRYFIDPDNPSIAILQEFAEPKPTEFKTISKMRFMNTTVKQVMFLGNYTITVTADNRFYMGVITNDPGKVYSRYMVSIAVDDMTPIVMYNGCHVIVSQFETGLFSRDRPDIVIYYDEDCNVCFKSCPKYGLDRYWKISSDSVWPTLTVDTEIIDNSSIVTSV